MTAGKSKVVLPGVSLILAFFYTLPFLLKLRWWGVRDWDLFTTIAAVPVGSIIHYGQFPFWNPYLGGGNILFHHPEVAVLSPFFLLYLAFGAVVGLKIQVLISYFLGFWGSQRLFVTLGMRRWTAVAMSVAYFGSVHLALHFAEGHMPFTHYAFLPWFLNCLLEANRDRRYLAGAVGALALMVLGNGAAVPFAYTMLLSAGLFGLRAVQHRNLRELGRLAAAAVLALGVAAVKFVPMVIYLVNNKWTGNPEEAIPPSALDNIFFGFSHSLFAKNFPQQQWAWHEYGAYISPILVGFALYALIKRFREQWPWLVLGAFFLLLGLGNFGALSPWAILTSLPGFESMRATGRSFHFVILAAAVLGGLGVDLLRNRLREVSAHKILTGAITGAVALVVLTNLAFAWPIMNSAFVHPPRHIVRSPVFRHVITEKPQAFENYLANRGSLVSPWLSAYHPSRGLVGPGDVVMPEYVLSGAAEVQRRDYTPNVITYEIIGNEPGRMVIGMGYDTGWRARDGRRLTATQGLISFPFESGEQTVVLEYRTPWFRTGLVVSGLFLVGVAGLWRRWRRR